MEFRTIIEPLKGRLPIGHDDRIVMVGSCFTDNMGAILKQHGFNVSVNAMGVLYNPLSIASVLLKALEGYVFGQNDLTVDSSGVYHALHFESRRQSRDPMALLAALNADFERFAAEVRECDILIVTFGTAFVFEHSLTKQIVGNCHKLPATEFARHRINADQIISVWQPLCQRFKRVIFTVSPVRHVADGLHGNQLSKATLLLATEKMGEYFPAYEIVNDDLRDYRFYASDLKHPSETAVQYIFEVFSDTYFSKETRAKGRLCKKQFLQQRHRSILNN